MWFNMANLLSLLFLNVSKRNNTICPVGSMFFKEQKNNEIKHPPQSEIYSLNI